jgi:hypothetical protein
MPEPATEGQHMTVLSWTDNERKQINIQTPTTSKVNRLSE